MVVLDIDKRYIERLGQQGVTVLKLLMSRLLRLLQFSLSRQIIEEHKFIKKIGFSVTLMCDHDVFLKLEIGIFRVADFQKTEFNVRKFKTSESKSNLRQETVHFS